MDNDEPQAPLNNDKRPDGIKGVKLATGNTHCLFCDTRIDQGWPCVERVWWHAGGPFTRNNGAATGVCPAGYASESMHAQCAWRLDPCGSQVSCNVCEQKTQAGQRLVSFIARPGQRCSETSPLYWCFSCCHDFVNQHRELLDGHIGSEQMLEGVAWVKDRPLFPPNSLLPGCGLPPMTASARKEFISIFLASDAEAEAAAVASHRKLQSCIVEAMRADVQHKGIRKATRPRGSPSVAAAAAMQRLETESPVLIKRHRAR